MKKHLIEFYLNELMRIQKGGILYPIQLIRKDLGIVNFQRGEG